MGDAQVVHRRARTSVVLAYLSVQTQAQQSSSQVLVTVLSCHSTHGIECASTRNPIRLGGPTGVSMNAAMSRTAFGGQGLRPYDPDRASGGRGSAPGPGRLRDARPGSASRHAPEVTRPRPPGPGRSSGGALHLDQPDAARPSEACATGCRSGQVERDLWEKSGRRSCPTDRRDPSQTHKHHRPQPGS
jgi:hypothetical protein